MSARGEGRPREAGERFVTVTAGNEFTDTITHEAPDLRRLKLVVWPHPDSLHL